MANYYDGDYSTPTQHGPVISWLDPVLRCTMYRITYHQKEADFAPLAIGTAGADSSYLVEEEEPKHIGGGMVEWDRIYMTIPPTRTEVEGYVYTRQWLVETIINGQPYVDLGELSLPVPSRVVFQYYHTSDPTEIEILRAFRYLRIGDGIYTTGSADNNTLTELLAEDSQVSRLKGNIWQRVDRYVSKASITVNGE